LQNGAPVDGQFFDHGKPSDILRSGKRTRIVNGSRPCRARPSLKNIIPIRPI